MHTPLDPFLHVVTAHYSYICVYHFPFPHQSSHSPHFLECDFHTYHYTWKSPLFLLLNPVHVFKYSTHMILWTLLTLFATPSIKFSFPIAFMTLHFYLWLALSFLFFLIVFFTPHSLVSETTTMALWVAWQTLLPSQRFYWWQLFLNICFKSLETGPKAYIK